MAIDTGGPAFPANTLDVSYKDASNPKYMGMSLLDYFAAAMLTGMISSKKGTEAVAEGAAASGIAPGTFTATAAYEQAAAMIARKKEIEDAAT